MTQLHKLSSFFFASAALLAGCSGGSDPSKGGATNDLRAEVKTLEARIQELSLKVEMLEFGNKVQEWDKVAYLTPGSQGYGVLRTNHMTAMTVSLKDVAAFANGSKVVLTFGNMSAAALTGLSAKVEYGQAGKDGPDNSTARSTTAKFPDTLRPGSWTNVPVVLEGVPPGQLGFVRVRDVEHNGIRLSGSN